MGAGYGSKIRAVVTFRETLRVGIAENQADATATFDPGFRQTLHVVECGEVTIAENGESAVGARGRIGRLGKAEWGRRLGGCVDGGVIRRD